MTYDQRLQAQCHILDEKQREVTGEARQNIRKTLREYQSRLLWYDTRDLPIQAHEIEYDRETLRPEWKKKEYADHRKYKATEVSSRSYNWD